MKRHLKNRNGPPVDLVSPREFLQSWNIEALEAVNVKAVQTEQEMHDDIARKMGISEETVKELSEVCGKDTLLCGMEPKNRLRMLEMRSAPEKAEAQLESLSIQIKERERRLENECLRACVSRRMKYNILDEYMSIVPADMRGPVENKEFQVPVPNVVLTIQVNKCLFQRDRNTKSRENEIYTILASQSLTDLRDKINCSSDAVIAGDYSSMSDVDPNTLQRAGDLYKSSFFFIEDCFYNDFRHPDNKDYSKPIIKWARDDCNIHNFTTKRMEDTTFADLHFSLGRHYLFTHQGNCEHSVVFSDMRLFTSEDIQDIRKYPLLCVARLKNRSVCQGCSKLSAKWMVQDCPLIPTDPCFLCKLCFKTLLYTKDGQKVSNFRAFHFSDFYT